MSSRGRIMVVDDEESITYLLKRVLEAEGYEVLTASNGREALEILQDRPVDLIITDYMMPEMDGLQVLRKLKEMGKLGEVKVIMLTVSDFKETLEEAINIGVYDYITKPFDFQEVIMAVNSAMKEDN